MKKLLFVVFTILLFCSQAWATDFDWYFSKSTGSDGGAGTEGSPWETITKMKTQITGLSISDTATIHLKRGDTWPVGYTNGIIDLPAANGIIKITAYGAGDLPCFDGEINFAALPEITPSSNFYNTVLWIHRDGSTVEYLEIKNIYGRAIHLWGTDGVTVQYCNFHDLGYDAISHSNALLENTSIQYNTMYNGMYLVKVGAYSGYAGFVNLNKYWQGNGLDIVIRHNIMYNSYGELININGGIAEYNILGTSRRSALFAQTGEGGITGKPTTFRYNLVYGTTSDAWNYSQIGGRWWSGTGITVQDEGPTGDNSAWDVKIYGNIVIGRGIGTHIYNNAAVAEYPIAAVKLYNNIFIDNYTNIGVGATTFFTDLRIYNNAFIRYDTTGSVANKWGTLSAGTYIGYNLLWIAGGSPTYSAEFATGAEISDPLLNGETKGIPVNWDGITAWTDLDFDNDLTFPSNSGLLNIANTLAGYEATLLAKGTNWDAAPTWNIETGEVDDGGWHAGAVVCDAVLSTGTIQTGLGGSNVNEAHIRAGADGDAQPITIIYTAVGTEWVATIGADNQITTDFLAAITCTSGVQAAGFEAQVRAVLVHGNLVRTSATVLTLTIPACAAYDLTTGNETWHTEVPASATVAAEVIEASPDVTISEIQPASTGVGLTYDSNGQTLIYNANGIKITISTN